MALTAKEQQTVKRARAHGIVKPDVAMAEFKRIKGKPVGFDFALLCGFLMIETRGGQNVFGHDPTIFIGAGTVTPAKYRAYLHLRNLVHRYQGVGGMQLTWYSYQDEADRLGGCWTAQANYRVGFQIVLNNIHRYGLWAGVAAYNGSGPAAREYSNKVLAVRATFEHLLAVAKPDPQALRDLPEIVEDMDGLARVAEDHAAERAADLLWMPH